MRVAFGRTTRIKVGKHIRRTAASGLWFWNFLFRPILWKTYPVSHSVHHHTGSNAFAIND